MPVRVTIFFYSMCVHIYIYMMHDGLIIFKMSFQLVLLSNVDNLLADTEREKNM